MKFEELNLKPYIKNNLRNKSFVECTPIQELVYSKIKDNKNIVVESATGSGKTHAYLVPIINSIDESLKQVQCVILSPTRELASQIYLNALELVESTQIDVKLYVGGSSREDEIKKLNNQSPQVIIGTIGRISDLAIGENVLKIYQAANIVIDEADMVIEKKTIEEVDKVLSKLSNNPRFWIFSATLTKELRVFMNKYLGGTQEVIIPEANLTKSTIKHIFIPVKANNKQEVLVELMKIINPYLCLIFVNQKEDVIALSKHLAGIGIKVGVLHGDLTDRDRKQTLKRISDNLYQYVVASDIASRGIDLEGVSHVINYDLPQEIDFYIHRTGRTARFDRTGHAITLYDYDDETYVNKLKEKGLIINFMKISNGELVPTKLNVRKQPSKRVQEIEEIHKKHPLPKKVKPGYKKKRMEIINKEIKKKNRERIENIYKKKNKAGK